MDSFALASAQTSQFCTTVFRAACISLALSISPRRAAKEGLPGPPWPVFLLSSRPFLPSTSVQRRAYNAARCRSTPQSHAPGYTCWIVPVRNAHTLSARSHTLTQAFSNGGPFACADPRLRCSDITAPASCEQRMRLRSTLRPASGPHFGKFEHPEECYWFFRAGATSGPFEPGAPTVS